MTWLKSVMMVCHPKSGTVIRKSLNISIYFSVQLGESTDITNKLTLLCYIRHEHEWNIFKHILFYPLVHIPAEELFNILNEFLTWHLLIIIGISTEGMSNVWKAYWTCSTLRKSHHWWLGTIAEYIAAKKIPELKQTLNESRQFNKITEIKDFFNTFAMVKTINFCYNLKFIYYHKEKFCFMFLNWMIWSNFTFSNHPNNFSW